MGKYDQNVQQIAQLVRDLEEARKQNKSEKRQAFTCKKHTFLVAGTNNVTVDSWKFMDWDYKRDGLPTYARGLFTTRLKNNTPEIAVRGYDKFFNVGETNDTQWRNIEHNTRGPYELSVKENGCIIFISGMEDGKLLVCSKHSTGVRHDTEISHAQAGERWVEKHVASVGKSSKDLAKALREMNVTAVGELCDDSFEEHVLAYDEASSGIYLHGLNYNLNEFATQSSQKVNDFADAWGFKKTKFEVRDDIESVKSFLEGCAETGTWDGRETEGFVVRCQMAKDDHDYRDWFFKYKFEEPYLMYRQWRECTKAVIGGRLPKIKKHEKITEEYLQFARRRFMEDKTLARDYNYNHGIISLREAFLKERGLNGSEIIAMEEQEGQGKNVSKNVILAPIASLGCGKTTVALALVHLFGWGHVQNDNIPKQKNKPKQFAFQITNELSTTPVVIADRNTHQRREREQLMNDVRPVLRDAKFVALHYVHEPKPELLSSIKEVTRKRVLDRGDNHQTIRAGTKDSHEIIGIMDGFLNRFEGINTNRHPDDLFDLVIDLDVCASSRENLETIVRAMHDAYPVLVPEIPSADDLDAAIERAMNKYEVKLDLSAGYSTKGPKGPKQKNGSPAPQSGSTRLEPPLLARKIEFFNIAIPTSEVTSTLHSLFSSSTPEVARLYHQLVNSRRVQPAFHVTLIHRASKDEQSAIWNRYTKQYIDTLTANPVADAMQNPPKLGLARVRLERLVWDTRIMAFVVRILPFNDQIEGSGQADFPCANTIPHVTVGTVAPSVKPKESNDLLKRWLELGSGGDTGIFEAEVPGVKVVEGTINVTMRR
jgi:tRNA ligase